MHVYDSVKGFKMSKKRVRFDSAPPDVREFEPENTKRRKELDPMEALEGKCLGLGTAGSA